MSREWKPGDVAVLMTEGGERIGFRCGVETNMGWEYAREPGQKTWSADTSGYVKPLRPLVVIDAEDREQVERLARCSHDAIKRPGAFDAMTSISREALTALMRDALREFADPRDPKPEEPTGLGAVARGDKPGVWWVKIGRDEWAEAGAGDTGLICSWSDVPATLVISDGVDL